MSEERPWAKFLSFFGPDADKKKSARRLDDLPVKLPDDSEKEDNQERLFKSKIAKKKRDEVEEWIQRNIGLSYWIQSDVRVWDWNIEEDRLENYASLDEVLIKVSIIFKNKNLSKEKRMKLEFILMQQFGSYYLKEEDERMVFDGSITFKYPVYKEKKV